MVSERNEQATEPIMCKNGCGFCGNPANENLCSKCYREYIESQTYKCESQASDYSQDKVDASYSQDACADESGSFETLDKQFEKVESLSNDAPNTNGVALKESEKQVTRDTSRCHCCRKAVGLLGFGCRCGFTFCSLHRQASAHKCEFDYKAFNKMQLEKRSVKVVADKLERL